MFIVWNPHEFRRLYNLHPWYWKSFSNGFIFAGDNSAHFLQLMPFTIFQFFIPPGIHYCWVARGSIEWEVCLTLLHMTSSWNRTPKLPKLNHHNSAIWHTKQIWWTDFSNTSHSFVINLTLCTFWERNFNAVSILNIKYQKYPGKL